MNFKIDINEIKTQGEARSLGMEFQEWSSKQSLSYGELINYQNDLMTIAEKFDLIEEFKENGII
jgi:hypothetical protein